MNRYTIITLIIFASALLSCKALFNNTKKFDGMVLVPGGEFIMGTNEVDAEGRAEAFGIPKPWFEDENPERKIYIDSFYIDKYEVTNREYDIFIKKTGYTLPPDWENGKFPSGEDNFPVTYVSFFDAQAYAEWAGKKIPTEPEWEKAARGKSGNKYPWGNEFNIHRANLSKSMTEVSHKMAVGSFKTGISPYGAFDMIGNVWEWTSSWYLPYEGNKKENPNYGKKFKSLRGLSFYYLGHFPGDMYTEILSHVSRGSYREEVFPTTKSPDVGFRCIKGL